MNARARLPDRVQPASFLIREPAPLNTPRPLRPAREYRPQCGVSVLALKYRVCIFFMVLINASRGLALGGVLLLLAPHISASTVRVQNQTTPAPGNGVQGGYGMFVLHDYSGCIDVLHSHDDAECLYNIISFHLSRTQQPTFPGCTQHVVACP